MTSFYLALYLAIIGCVIVYLAIGVGFSAAILKFVKVYMTRHDLANAGDVELTLIVLLWPIILMILVVLVTVGVVITILSKFFGPGVRSLAGD